VTNKPCPWCGTFHEGECKWENGLEQMEDDEDELEEAEMNCGELPEGGCSLAGTEYCDWSCPFSDGMVKRMNEKR